MKNSSSQLLGFQIRNQPGSFWLIWGIYCFGPILADSTRLSGRENALWIGGLLSLAAGGFGIWLLLHPSRLSIYLGRLATPRGEFLFSRPVSRRQVYLVGAVFYLALVLLPPLVHAGWVLEHRGGWLPSSETRASASVDGWILLQITLVALLAQMFLILPLTTWRRAGVFFAVALPLLCIPLLEVFEIGKGLTGRCATFFSLHWISFALAIVLLLPLAEWTAWKQAAEIEV